MRMMLSLLLLLPTLASAQEKERVLFYPKPLHRGIQGADEAGDASGRPEGEEPGQDDVARAGDQRRQFRVVHGAGAAGHADTSGGCIPTRPRGSSCWTGRFASKSRKPDRTFEIINATKGSYVFVPERMLHSLEVVGQRAGDPVQSHLGSVIDACLRKAPRGGAGRRSSSCP